MRTFFECLPCFVKQALGALENCNATNKQTKLAMQLIFCELAKINYTAAPPVTAQKIHRIVARTLRVNDPYAHHKQRFNQFAAALLPAMQDVCLSYKDSFSKKVNLSIAANLIDFAKNCDLTENDVQSNLERAVRESSNAAALENLKEAIRIAKKILFLCDNAGEIVFDRFLIEEMPFEKVICGVRGAPVLNDATLEDAHTTGLTNIVRVVSNGSDAPGTVLEECSSEFRQLFAEADLVISKGQGNFETLSDNTDKKIFFLFQVKCPVIARDAGYPEGALVIIENGANVQAR